MSNSTKSVKKRDIGWEHGEMINNNPKWTKCKYCGKEMKGSGVSRLKEHIADGSSNVPGCEKCPLEIARAMRDHLKSKKQVCEEVKQTQAALRETLMGPIRRKFGIISDSDGDECDEEDMSMTEKEQLNLALKKSIQEVHGDTSSSRSNKRKLDTFWGKKKTLGIEDIDPVLYRNRECTQKKIPNMVKGNNAFKAAKHAIGKWFIYSNIPANVYYQAQIDEIARAGVGVIGPTPYEITGPILDAEIAEIKEYVSNFKKKWDTYGVTIMCDGWTSTTRLSIINFLVYCDGKTVFHKSVNASDKFQDANYIYELMDDVVEEIGEKYVVQVITDNGSAYRKAGELLMRKQKHLYWSPCTAHCIDLILEDFAAKTPIKSVIEPAKRISNFIYNHNKVLALMRKYTDGKELLRPGATRFATNYIAIESIVQQKENLQRMFTSREWLTNSASKTTKGEKVQEVILNPSFWKNAQVICNLHAPVSRVLHMVDGEKQATMSYVYEGMRISKSAIQKALPKSHKQYLDIIDKRMSNQMIKDLHLAAYYLNPQFHYELDLSHNQELLDALKRVVKTLEPDSNKASLALAEGKIFREAMFGFGDSTAIKGRTKTEPADWWFTYGSDAPNLKKLALRILSQTASSSGCERNWSTFSLIHTKVRNRINYQKLERLVYAHYNMRLRLRHIMKDKTKVDRCYQPIDLSNIFDEDDVLSEWLDDPGDALLDEHGDDDQPPRPNTFLATCVEQYSDSTRDEESAYKGKNVVPDVVNVSEDDDDFDCPSMSPMETIVGNMDNEVNTVRDSINTQEEIDFDES